MARTVLFHVSTYLEVSTASPIYRRFYDLHFPNISMVNKPSQTLLGYSNIWSTNNSYNNFLYLIWSTIRGERNSQKLIDYNYTPIDPIGTEMSWTIIFPGCPNWRQHKEIMYIFSNNFCTCGSPSQVVCVTASGQPGHGFEQAVLPSYIHPLMPLLNTRV